MKEYFDIIRFSDEGPPAGIKDVIITEALIRIVANGQELAVASHLPEMQRELAIGFLLSNGLISSLEDVLDWELDGERGVIYLEIRQKLPAAVLSSRKKAIGSGCMAVAQVISTDDLTPMGPGLAIPSPLIQEAAMALQAGSDLFRETGGVHSAALCQEDGSIILRAEDVGRHNAFDKIAGACLLSGVDVSRCFAVCTGRLSSEIVTKAWRLGLPILASRSSTTSRAVEIARKAGITLLGFVRKKKMNVYSAPWRIAEVRQTCE
jgi:FdhD protein